jgi:hypothetical protein
MVLVMVVSLPVDLVDGAKLTTKEIALYSQNRPLHRNISLSYGWSSASAIIKIRRIMTVG